VPLGTFEEKCDLRGISATISERDNTVSLCSKLILLNIQSFGTEIEVRLATIGVVLPVWKAEWVDGKQRMLSEVERRRAFYLKFLLTLSSCDTSKGRYQIGVIDLVQIV
jgi:hypothetical protein